MSVDDVIKIINNVGFPIAAYGALFYVMFASLGKRLDEVTSALNKLSERLSVLIAQNDDRESTI